MSFSKIVNKHDYKTTAESFQIFEHHLVHHSMVVLHDVGCCSGEYPGLKHFVEKRFLNSLKYKEIIIDIPDSWKSFTVHQREMLQRALNESLDKRPSFREKSLRSFGKNYSCDQICGKHRCHLEYGYAWSWCKNTRIFQFIDVV
jgi:hypothetical protein